MAYCIYDVYLPSDFCWNYVKDTLKVGNISPCQDRK